MRDLRESEKQMLTFECRYCWARAGEWCITKGGWKSNLLHSARWRDWKISQVTS